MAFGIFIDQPLLSAVIILTTIYRKRIAALIKKVKLPKIILYILTAIPLIIFEEHINCMPSWCLHVLIPPTLPFLLIQTIIVGLIFAKFFSTKSILVPTFLYSAFGLLWEFTAGGLVGLFSKAALSFAIFMIGWTGISYAFLVIVPLTILMKTDTVSM